MAHSFTLPEQSQQVTLLPPAADAAGRTAASAVTLKNGHKAYVIFTINGGAASTVLCTVLQCSDVAKTGAKAIPAVPVWSNLAEATSSTLVRQTDAVSQTTDAALTQKRIVFEIDPGKLDIANGFKCLTVSTGASSVSNITAAEIIVMPLRHDALGAPNLLAN